jgi:UDP-glucuronate 4-epimerase
LVVLVEVMQKVNILLTGAAGFIGSHLSERLVREGNKVVGLDNFDPFYETAVKRNNIAGLLSSPNFKLIEGDIRDRALAEKIFREGRFDTVVHLAARAGVRPSIVDPVGYADTNINGTVVLLEAARTAGIKKFIFASSSSVYGNNEKVPFSETDNVDNPISPYAATKKAGELICYTYSHLYNMNITCLRFFTVYGPRQRPDLAIHKFARLIEQGKTIPVFGDGSMERDFTYIEDIIDGVVASMKQCQGYHIYNLGESRPVRLDVLIAELEKALGKKAMIDRQSEQPGDVKRTFADVKNAMCDLGYQPKTQFADGVKHFVAWMRKK